MTCKDAIELLGEYLEMALTPETLVELERHLADCPPCQAYLRTYRATRELVGAVPRADPPPEMPAEMKSRLRAFLLAQLLKGER